MWGLASRFEAVREMCACEHNFTCARCALRWPLDLDPYHQDPAELEQERMDVQISRPDWQREGVDLK